MPSVDVFVGVIFQHVAKRMDIQFFVEYILTLGTHPRGIHDILTKYVDHFLLVDKASPLTPLRRARGILGRGEWYDEFVSYLKHHYYVITLYRYYSKRHYCFLLLREAAWKAVQITKLR